MKKNIFKFNKVNMGYFFFGVGVTMFILNMISIMEFINFVNAHNLTNVIPYDGFYVSLVSSLILMTYSLYNVFTDK